MPDLLSSPLAVNSAVDEITRRLEGAILSGEIELGAALNEQLLAKSLGVSRGPLREALRSLEGRRLVERIPNVGARVVRLSERDVREIYQLREVLEGAACRIATEAMAPAARGEFLEFTRSVLARYKENARSYTFDVNLDFHQRVLQAAGNRRLMDLMNGDLFYLLRVLRRRSHSLPHRPLESLEEHCRIAEAIAAGDGERADMLMREHIRNAAREAIEAFVWR